MKTMNPGAQAAQTNDGAEQASEVNGTEETATENQEGAGSLVD
jgi:hypothetical protein